MVLLRNPLPLVVDALRGLAALPALERSLRRLAAADGPLDRLADVSETLRRLAGFDESLRRLSALEESLDRIAMVGESLERLAVTTEGLGELPAIVAELHITVQQLGASIQPIGRIAGRIPGSGSRADRRVRAQQTVS
jgi:hypothetical protein